MKTVFNLEDIKKAFLQGCYSVSDYIEGNNKTKDYDIYEEADLYTQSLSTQQLPKEFIVTYDLIPVDKNGNEIKSAKFIIPDNSDDPRNNIGTFKDLGMHLNPIDVIKSFNKKVIRTVINSEGKSELVGTYKY